LKFAKSEQHFYHLKIKRHLFLKIVQLVFVKKILPGILNLKPISFLRRWHSRIFALLKVEKVKEV